MGFRRRYGRLRKRRKFGRKFGRRARVSKMSRLRRKVHRSRRVLRRGVGIRSFNTRQGFGRTLKVIHGVADTTPITTSVTASQIQAILWTVTGVANNGVAFTQWPPATSGSSIYSSSNNAFPDMRTWVNANAAVTGSIDGTWGMLNALLNSYTYSLMTGIKITCVWEPESAHVVNNVAFFIAATNDLQNQAYQSLPVAYDFLRMLPRRMCKMRSMPATTIAGADVGKTVKISKYFGWKHFDTYSKKDPIQYRQLLTGQQGIITSLGIGLPASNLGHIHVGFCSKDGGTFTGSTTYFRLRTYVKLYLRLAGPVTYMNSGV